MNQNQPQNLDYAAMEASQHLAGHIGDGRTQIAAKDAFNSFTKTLAILQSSGVYSTILYLLSEIGGVEPNKLNQGQQKDKRCCLLTTYYAWKLVNETVLSRPFGEKEPLYLTHTNARRKLLSDVMEQICRDTRTTLFARTVLERLLTYARYNAKALQLGDSES